MRILFLTPQLPYPLHQGTAVRNYGLIQGLAERHQVSLLSFLEPNQSLDAAAPLLASCQRVETTPAPPARRPLRACVWPRRPLPTDWPIGWREKALPWCTSRVSK